MDEYLYEKWLNEEVEDAQLALAMYGIRGFLANFESWLEREGHIDDNCQG